MSCGASIDAGTLADYWVGLLAEMEEEPVEFHLLTCDECGARLRDVIELAEGVRAVARKGSLRMVVSESMLGRATREGLCVREYAPPAGGAVNCTVTADDDLLVARLAANLGNAGRVDLCVCDESGSERQRLRDVPIQAGGGGVLLQESITIAKAMGSGTMIIRMVSLDDSGGERVLGEYTFHHTRSLPPAGV